MPHVWHRVHGPRHSPLVSNHQLLWWFVLWEFLDLFSTPFFCLPQDSLDWHHAAFPSVRSSESLVAFTYSLCLGRTSMASLGQSSKPSFNSISKPPNTSTLQIHKKPSPVAISHRSARPSVLSSSPSQLSGSLAPSSPPLAGPRGGRARRIAWGLGEGSVQRGLWSGEQERPRVAGAWLSGLWRLWTWRSFGR